MKKFYCFIVSIVISVSAYSVDFNLMRKLQNDTLIEEQEYCFLSGGDVERRSNRTLSSIISERWNHYPCNPDSIHPPYSEYVKYGLEVPKTFIWSSYIGDEKTIGITVSNHTSDFLVFCFYRDSPEIFSYTLSSTSQIGVHHGTSARLDLPCEGYYSKVQVSLT